MIDEFSAFHVMAWFLGTFVLGIVFNHRLAVVAGLASTWLWELVEVHWVEPWLRFHEPSANRWFLDPLAGTVGTIAAVALVRWLQRRPA